MGKTDPCCPRFCRIVTCPPPLTLLEDGRKQRQLSWVGLNEIIILSVDAKEHEAIRFPGQPWQATEKVILLRLLKNGQMQGTRNPEE